jgi:hypothetical protein
VPLNIGISENNFSQVMSFDSTSPPRLILVATKTIPPGSELLYDYGDRYWVFYMLYFTEF